MTVMVLGTAYTVENRDNDPALVDADGYCDWTTKTIVLARNVAGNLHDMGEYRKKVLRHEIVHAFLLESGLHECSGEVECWAANETMVDWIARQGAKIYKAWEEAACV